jgi:hypothetical protein
MTYSMPVIAAARAFLHNLDPEPPREFMALLGGAAAV